MQYWYFSFWQPSDEPTQGTLHSSEPIWFGIKNALRPHALADVNPRQGLNPQPSALKGMCSNHCTTVAYLQSKNKYYSFINSITTMAPPRSSAYSTATAVRGEWRAKHNVIDDGYAWSRQHERAQSLWFLNLSCLLDRVQAWCYSGNMGTGWPKVKLHFANRLVPGSSKSSP